jgi:hypothetical protein
MRVMPNNTANLNWLLHASYYLAWQEFLEFSNLTVEERKNGAHQLRWYITLLVEAGESSPRKIALSALNMHLHQRADA